MKPYGVPRTLDVEYPDQLDIRIFGFKSSISRNNGKSGKRKNSFHSSSLKRRVRRFWKKKARKQGKDSCKEITN